MDAADDGSWRASRWPLVWVAGCVIGGITVHGCLPIHPWRYTAGAVLMAAGAAILYRQALVCQLLLIMGFLLAGVQLGQLQVFYFPAVDIAAFATEEERLAEVEVRIVDPPRLVGQSYSGAPRQWAAGRVERIWTTSGWRPAEGDILLHLGESHPRLAVNQRVRALGMLSRPQPADNPGQFDWSKHYRRQRVAAALSVRHLGNLLILEQSPPSWLDQLRLKTRQLLGAGFPPEQSLDHALLRALLLGDRFAELREVQEDFTRTGTGHHLSTSGMHVAVVACVVYGLCRLLGVSPSPAAGIGLAVTLLYGLVTLPSPPIVRSILLSSAFAVGILRGRCLSGVQLLCLAVLLMLIYDPLDLYNAGFQLSFGTVLGMMLLADPMARWLGRVWNEDVDLAIAQQLAPQMGRTMRAWARRRTLTILGAGIAAWAVSAPMIAVHFEQLNPWTILASIILAPLVFLSVVAGVAKVTLTLLWPGMASGWAWLAIQPVGWMRQCVDALAHIPGSDRPLSPPGVWLLLAWYGLLLLPLLPLRAPRWRRALGWASALGLGGLAVSYVALARPEFEPGSVRLTLLSVGAGQCAVVELPGREALLIDCGSAGYTELRRRCIEPFLRQRGIRRIAGVFLSHANTDHFSAVAEVAQVCPVRRVYVSPCFADHLSINPAAGELLESLKSLRIPLVTLEVGERLEPVPELTVEPLWPGDRRGEQGNDLSQVLRLCYGGRSILFTGDLQSAGQRRLLAAPEAIRADVLIAPHHGSAEATTEEFLKAVSPRYILSSNDHTLTQKQQRFGQLLGNAALYRTHAAGAITLLIHRDGQMDLRPFRR